MILPCLYISQSEEKGRGVFTSEDLEADSIVEISPVIVMSKEERQMLDKTTLHDYIFEWGEEKNQCCMALGYIPVYNHSYSSNCEYEMDFEAKTMSVKTIRTIKKGEELFVNYNATHDDDTPIWFDVT